MEHNYSHSGIAAVRSTLVTLPPEVLWYIVSFLSTRDKVRIRCVSNILRSISEIPSLWETFIWSHFTPHDEELLEHVFNKFGQHIKRFHFAQADHVVPSKLEVMLKFCKNVVHLSLPAFNYYNNFKKLENIVYSMGSLQMMDTGIRAFTKVSDIQQMFKLSSNLKELSLHYEQSTMWCCDEMQQWLEEWVNLNYVPRKLNIIVSGEHGGTCTRFVLPLQSYLPVLQNKKLSKISDLDDIAWLNICFKTSDFLPLVPYIQVRVTDSSVALPSVKASKYGLLGLDLDTLHLAQDNYRGKKVHKALFIGGIDEYLDTSITSLTSVTYFDASYCRSLYPGHLEQLSVACPNLQRLDLRDNSECLSNLQGLCSLANNCKNLQGLNLRGIPVTDCEYLQLWEILCTMHLTELSIEAWTINVQVAVKRQKLINMFQKYSSLQVLEVCCPDNLSDSELLLVSYFPSITSYRLCNLPNNNCYHTLKQIFAYKYLKCLYLSQGCGMLSLSLKGHYPSLQQLYIHSVATVPTESFIDTLCGHGGLEHVILSVESLTARSIMNIIEHSSNLVTFGVSLWSEDFTNTELIQLIATIKTKFSKRKLFNGGNFDMRVYSMIQHSLMLNTDLLSVWTSNAITVM